MATPLPSSDLAHGVELRKHDRFNLELTSVRVHAVALNRWFNSAFLVADGYPIPVIFATPMDAFSKFNLLWSRANNPFLYLKEIDSPHVDPTNPKFPLINISFKGATLRPEQNYGSRVFRRIDWQTVSGVESGVTKSNLGISTQARYPQAWNFQYQVDFWCLRPDTQSIFIDQLIERFKFGGGSAQAFVSTVYPGYVGWTLCRTTLDGNSIQDTTEKDPGDSVLKFRTTFGLTVEGWKPDLDRSYVPTLWYAVFGDSAISSTDLTNYYSLHEGSRYGVDLRTSMDNPVVKLRSDMPPTAAPPAAGLIPTVPAATSVAAPLAASYLPSSKPGSITPNPSS